MTLARSARSRRFVAMFAAGALALSTLTVLPVGHAAAASSAAAEPVNGPVTVVGSLQGELGCAENWDPDCELTDLTLDPATQKFTKQFELPQGSWEFKVAVNRSWDQSYGKDGGPDNIPLVLAGSATIEFGFDPESHRISIQPVDLPPTTGEQDAALAGNSLREDLTRDGVHPNGHGYARMRPVAAAALTAARAS